MSKKKSFRRPQSRPAHLTEPEAIDPAGISVVTEHKSAFIMTTADRSALAYLRDWDVTVYIEEHIKGFVIHASAYLPREQMIAAIAKLQRVTP